VLEEGLDRLEGVGLIVHDQDRVAAVDSSGTACHWCLSSLFPQKKPALCCAMIHAAIRKNGDAFSTVEQTRDHARRIANCGHPRRPPASIVYTGTFASVRSDVA
jgi:hypothetical protein